MADALCTLETAFIGWNAFGNQGIALLSGALKQNNSLKCLSVADCRITDIGVASLTDARALSTNTTLESLHIQGNDALTENGLMCLVVLYRDSGMTRLVELAVPKHLYVNYIVRMMIINEV